MRITKFFYTSILIYIVWSFLVFIILKIVSKLNTEENLIANYDDNNAKMYSSDAINKLKRHIQNKFNKLYDINCTLILNKDEYELNRATRLLSDNKNEYGIIDENKLIFDKSYCPLFRQIRGYDSHPIKDSEYEFPLAFSILVYYNVEQLERLLKLIYRPQNVYCIHIDLKSSIEVHKAIESIVQCFDNVFISSKLEDVIYAGISRLKADINCMRDLINFKNNFTHNNKIVPKWKYFINLASTEFPLRTNYELTEILRLFNGANDIEILYEYPHERVKYSWKTKYEYNKLVLVKSNSLKSPPPYDFNLTKGFAYGAFSRNFVKYSLENVHAKALLKWAEDTQNPDEW